MRFWSGGAGDRRGAALALQDAQAMANAAPGCRSALDRRRGELPPELRSLARRAWSPVRAAGKVVRAVRRRPWLLIPIGILASPVLAGCGLVCLAVLFCPDARPRAADVSPATRQSLTAPPTRSIAADPPPPRRTVAVRFATRDVSVAIGGTVTLRIEVAEPLPDEVLTVRFECPPSLTVPELAIEPGQIGATARLTAGTRPGKYRVTLAVAGAANLDSPTTCTVTVTETPPQSAPPAAPPVAVVPTPKPAPKSPRATTTPDRITADYLPFSPGTIWEYETVTLSGPGAGSAVRTRVEHIEGGRLETTIVRTGTANPKGEVRWSKDLNQKGATIVLAEGRNGRIELAGEPVLVVGSGPRDTWDYRPPTGGLTTFTVLGFDRENGQEQVRVRSRLDQAEYHVITTRTFVRGVGEVERAVELLRGGVVTPLSRMRRVGE